MALMEEMDESNLAQYDETLIEIKGLDDEKMQQLGDFAFGMKTVKEIPAELAPLAIKILEQCQFYRGELISWVQGEAKRRKTGNGHHPRSTLSSSDKLND